MPRMNAPKRVLVTGSAGRLGRAAVCALTANGHHVVGFDRVATPGLPADRSIIGSLADVETVNRVMSGCDGLIHLAATPDDAKFPRGMPPNDGDNFLTDLVPNNIVGAYTILEAARRAGVARIVLASTGQVIDGQLRMNEVPVTVSVPIKPRYLYACTKVFLEAIGQVYAVQHGMTVLAVRLGWCPRDLGQVAEIRASHLAQDVFFSPGDAGRFFTATVEAPAWSGFQLVYAASRSTHLLRYDLAPAERLLGYVPQDQWPTGAEEF